MKLLIVTQVLDSEHPILGFFHEWVAEFASQVESIEVIALQVGSHTLPANVQVHSLGKESGENRLKYLYRFYRYCFALRHHYDGVFVHMNQIYVMLGFPLWRIFGKRIGLWYAHGSVSSSLKVAVTLADVIFTSTPEGLKIDTPKRVIVGQGIEYTKFVGLRTPTDSDVLKLITVGRISPSKQLETLLAACTKLKEQGVPFTFTIVGTTLTATDEVYKKGLVEYCIKLGLTDSVIWTGGVAQKQLPKYLAAAAVFIHDGATQSLDKALLEAVAAGCVVVSSNAAYRAFTEEMAPQYLFTSGNSTQLRDILFSINAKTEAERSSSMAVVQTGVKSQHSLPGLISKIITQYE
jgi:glycosyltransferase involved in cell wall biosynthesis